MERVKNEGHYAEIFEDVIYQYIFHDPKDGTASQIKSSEDEDIFEVYL